MTIRRMKNRPATFELHQRIDGTFGLYVTGNMACDFQPRARVRLQPVNGVVVDRMVDLNTAACADIAGAIDVLVRAIATSIGNRP